MTITLTRIDVAEIDVRSYVLHDEHNDDLTSLQTLLIIGKRVLELAKYGRAVDPI